MSVAGVLPAEPRAGALAGSLLTRAQALAGRLHSIASHLARREGGSEKSSGCGGRRLKATTATACRRRRLTSRSVGAG